MTVTLIHAIENKYNHKFERQLKVYLDSLQRNNPNLFNKVKILFVQPTDNDVDSETIEFIKSYGASFVKISIKSGQSNQHQNFTNNVNSIAAVLDIIDTDYICWLDTDILFLKNDPNFFLETDSIVFSLLPVPEKTELKVYTHAGEIDTATDINLLYQKYFRKHLPIEYQFDKLEIYANTWLTYGKKNSNFWKEWRNLTHKLIEIVHLYPEQVEKGLESICEELAASILYYTNKYKIETLPKFFGENRTAMIFTTDTGLDFTSKCSLLHYIDILEQTMPELQGNYNNDYRMILRKMWEKKALSNQDYLCLLQELM